MFKRLFLSSIVPKRLLNSNIPRSPVKPPKFEGKITVDQATILHLERLSLVDFASDEGLRRLEEAIGFAQPLKEVDTTSVEPMYTVLDDQTLRLAEDNPDSKANGNCPRKELMQNAHMTEDDYFVAPPGNIPLKQDPKRFLKTTS